MKILRPMWAVAAALLALKCAVAPAIAAETVKIGLASLPPFGGNPYMSTARTSWYTWRALFDTLTTLGPDVAPVPALATAWRNTSPTTWVVELRPGVTFSNGEPVDAAAVAATIAYLKSPAALQDSVARDVDNIAGVRVIDDTTVEFTTTAPDPMFARQLATFAIVPPKAWASMGRDGFTQAPIGSGPFKVDNWGQARIELSAFEQSWRAPKSTRVSILALPETSTRISALLAGQVHVASEIGPEDVATLEGAGLTVYSRPASSLETIALRAYDPDATARGEKSGPLADARVRLALNMAINREAIAAALWAGLVKPSGQVVPRNNPDYDPTIPPYPYDPVRAKALLAEAGYPDGFKFVTVMSSGTSGSHIRASFEAFAADLAKIGVIMEVRPVPWSQWVRGVLQGEWLGDAFGFEFETMPTGDSLRPFRLHSCTWPHPWYCDPSIQPVIAEAKAEFDPARRQNLVHQILHAYHDQAATLLMFEQLGLDGVSPKLKGYSQMNGIIPYQDLVVE